jgi:glycosyltransferase involved in cell wall biosynthesis
MEDNIPLFSVVIPTYNRSIELERCLNSLVSQTFQDFEVIVCDDGSTDNTESVVRSFESALSILYVYNNNWGGPARPRNVGISMARGEWICFLDSDDWFYSDKLNRIRENLNSDVIYHDLGEYDKNSNLRRVRKSSRLKDPKLDLMLYGNLISNSSLTVRKSALVSVGYVSEDRNLISIEDYDLLIRLARSNFSFFYINNCLGAYSWSFSESNISYSDSVINKLNYLWEKYRLDYSNLDQKKILNNLNYRYGRYCMLFADYSKASFFFKKCEFSLSITFKLKSLLCLLFIKLSDFKKK